MPQAMGMVTAARSEAAVAGARALASGGSAADAAVATAFALCVTDPANCGLGGYGGYAVVLSGGCPMPQQVEFNTAAPCAFEPECLRAAPRLHGMVCGGPSVTRPSVVPGLWQLHTRFGRLPWKEVVAPAVELARDGFVAGPDLARALGWARQLPEMFGPSFWHLFEPGGAATTEDSRLRLPQLAASLETIANADGELAGGVLVRAMVSAVRRVGGSLGLADFSDHEVAIAPAEIIRFGPASIYGPRPHTTGFGVLADALASTDAEGWPRTRDARYLSRIGAALREAWRLRLQTARSVLAEPARIQHTTHLCTADSEGGLIAMTLTHGPLWFGSGIVADDTGIILNCGANLLVRSERSQELFAQTNLTPVIASNSAGSWHATGTPGGHRIPAVVMTALIDMFCSGLDLEKALGRPRMAIAADGTLEVELPLLDVAPDAQPLGKGDFYGPASGITVRPTGMMTGTTDPRFNGAVVMVGRDGSLQTVGCS